MNDNLIEFNNTKPIVLNSKDQKYLNIIMKELELFYPNFRLLSNRFSTNTVDNTGININFANTFSNNIDFIAACTILRPFILTKECFYNRGHQIIRNVFGTSNNSLFKNIFCQIFPTNLNNINTLNLVYSNTQITALLKQYVDLKGSSNDRIINYIIQHRKSIIRPGKSSEGLSMGGYKFFEFYLNGYVYHRDEDIQNFIENILNIKNINEILASQDPSNFVLINQFYFTCLQILNLINEMGKILNSINYHIINKSLLSICIDDSDKDNPSLIFNK